MQLAEGMLGGELDEGGQRVQTRSYKINKLGIDSVVTVVSTASGNEGKLLTVDRKCSHHTKESTFFFFFIPI